MAPPDTDLEFEPEIIIGISPVGRDAIQDYVSVLSDVFLRAVMATERAVDNFETSMAHESTGKADPDILGAMLGAAIDSSIKGFLKGIGNNFPAVPVAFAVFKALKTELEDTAKANQAVAESVRVRDFIIDQRQLVSHMSDRFDRLQVAEEVALEFSAVEPEEATVERLLAQAEQLDENADSVALTNECEQRIWERWIQAHFQGFTEDGHGCIEIVFEPDSDGASLRGVKIAMPKSSRGKITDALKRIMKVRASVRSPLNFAVKKRLRFINTENFVGGSQDDFGWVDERNKVLHEPMFKDSRRIFGDPGWRQFIRKFK